MNKYSLNSEEKNLLKYLILQGTSDICRLRLWLICSGAQNEIKLNPTYYNDLLNLSKEVPSLYANDIENEYSIPIVNKRISSKTMKDKLSIGVESTTNSIRISIFVKRFTGSY